MHCLDTDSGPGRNLVCRVERQERVIYADTVRYLVVVLFVRELNAAEVRMIGRPPAYHPDGASVVPEQETLTDTASTK